MVVNLQTTLPKLSARLPPTREMVTDGEAFLARLLLTYHFLVLSFVCLRVCFTGL